MNQLKTQLKKWMSSITQNGSALSLKRMALTENPRLLAKWLGLLLLSLILMHQCSKKKALEIPKPQVQVQKPQSRPMVDYIYETGNIVAYNVVDLVARVEGYLQAIEFTDGTYVAKGKELFLIQPEPYADKVKAAKADLEIAREEVQYSKSEFARQQKMYRQHATSLNNVEKWSAKSKSDLASEEKQSANLDLAEINYSYTHVLSPFDGRIGRHQVSVGNLVGNGAATVLATIEQIDPLYVYFNMNELDLIKLRKAAMAMGITEKNLDQIPISVALQNETDFRHQARLDFVNTGLNASTGTIQLRAILKNPDHFFVPGLFVQLRLAVSKPSPQWTVPDTAVQYDQIGAYLYVLDKEDRVLLRRVRLGALDQGIRAIAEGLSAADRVIVNGIQNASPGGIVQAELVGAVATS